ncbi:hypothetical protein [Klebsiella pneumoniae]|uniref:hypothetical protein n=1 Tax=Klebsiella pneumoniae TaxID=573 RepID=UPI001934A0C7|nr:hypothetical protein [Klebsiella pneumoniae]MBM0423905.1 hypothetical protein [Klebsiella pneumoniae]MBM0543529.1 hypothetical protein [Klebsiella pneumoniae]
MEALTHYWLNIALKIDGTVRKVCDRFSSVVAQSYPQEKWMNWVIKYLLYLIKLIKGEKSVVTICILYKKKDSWSVNPDSWSVNPDSWSVNPDSWSVNPE